MKYERLRTYLTAAVLAFWLTVGSMGCLITGFRLPIADERQLLGIWGAACVIFSGLLGACRGMGGVVSLLALAAGYLWREGQIVQEGKALVYRIGSLYGNAYGFSAPYRAEAAENMYADFPIGAMGVILSTLICISVCRRKTTFFAVLGALLPLGLCMVVTDTVPESWALFLLLTGLALLVISGGTRKESASQGNRLAAAAAIPVTLAAALLFFLIPRTGYVNRTSELRAHLLSYTQWFPAVPETDALYTLPVQVQETVNLAALNGQPRRGNAVMTVTAEEAGSLYLRGQDYDRYTGKGWEATAGRREAFGGWGEKRGAVTVRTRSARQVRYLPYYPEMGTDLEDGRIRNADGSLEYTVSQYTMGSAVGAEVMDANRMLPEATREAAQKWITELEGRGAGEIADAIGSIVRESAVYDRRTGRMPQEAEDFALWFLDSSETGYCVHFATAAVVLLRAAGIPARYVTGYLAEAASGEETEVTEDQAHAWAEYYDAEAGEWKILEATPGETPEEMPEDGETETIPEPETVEAMPSETRPPEAPESEPEAVDSAQLLRYIILGGICLAGVLALWRRLCLWWRKWRRNRETGNGRALLMWREAERLAAFLGEKVPEELAELAEKAGYSQHLLMPEELQPFGEYRRQCRRKLQKKPWYYQLVYRYIYVLY